MSTELLAISGLNCKSLRKWCSQQHVPVKVHDKSNNYASKEELIARIRKHFGKERRRWDPMRAFGKRVQGRPDLQDIKNAISQWMDLKDDIQLHIDGMISFVRKYEPDAEFLSTEELAYEDDDYDNDVPTETVAAEELAQPCLKNKYGHSLNNQVLANEDLEREDEDYVTDDSGSLRYDDSDVPGEPLPWDDQRSDSQESYDDLDLRLDLCYSSEPPSQSVKQQPSKRMLPQPSTPPRDQIWGAEDFETPKEALKSHADSFSRNLCTIAYDDDENDPLKILAPCLR